MSREHPGDGQRPRLEPDGGGELGAAGDGLSGADGLRVHRPEAAGTAGRAGAADGGRSLLVQHQHLPGGLGPQDGGV